jgi:hypothetical protein
MHKSAARATLCLRVLRNEDFEFPANRDMFFTPLVCRNLID